MWRGAAKAHVKDSMLKSSTPKTKTTLSLLYQCAGNAQFA